MYAEKEKLQELRNLIRGVKGTFVCSGVATPENEGVIITLNNNNAKVVFSQALQDEVKPLVAAAPQAPFGHGNQTIFNKEVRDAKQLKYADNTFSVSNFDPAKAGILDTVKSKLLPHDPSPLTAELYNLNIYENGGHFQPHRDTPRGADMIGTLVALLPSHFNGGKFVVKHQNLTAEFDWSKDIDKESNVVHWAAFFGDCEHNIERMYYGYRVTLSYILRKGSTGDIAAPIAPVTEDAIVQEIAEKLRECIQDVTFMPGGATLGFPCGHLYSNEATFTKPLPALTNATAMKLKGTDQKVGLGALSAGVQVSLVPYLQESCADCEWQLEHFPKTIKKLPWKLSTDMLSNKFPIKEEVTPWEIKDPKKKIEWIEPRPVSMTQKSGFVKEGQADNPNPAIPAMLSVGHANWSNTGYFGNEASETDFYLYAALLIKVPPVTNGVREQPAPLPVPDPNARKRKYIESALPFEKMTTDILKNELRARGLKLGGSKPELLERLQNYEDSLLTSKQAAKEMKLASQPVETPTKITFHAVNPIKKP